MRAAIYVVVIFVCAALLIRALQNDLDRERRIAVAPRPPARDPDPPRPDLSADDTQAERTPSAREIARALDTLFRGAGVDAKASDVGDTLMIAARRGQCDANVLRDLRKALAALELDPALRFERMRCFGGAELRLP